MVSIIWSVISFATGLLGFMLPALIGGSLPVQLRQRVARWYFGMSQSSFRQTALVWRTLGGPELMPVGIDDEQRLAQVTLSSGLISDDNTLPFKDPDDRIHRLQGKPFAVIPELLPAAVDAEVATISHWFREHDRSEGRVEETSGGDIRVNPYPTMDPSLRLVNPLDSMFLLGGNGVEPSYIETAKQITKQRFEKYGSRIGAAETLGTLMGFGAGVGGVAGIQYLRQNTLAGSGGGGGGDTLPIPPGTVVNDAVPLLVDLAGVIA